MAEAHQLAEQGVQELILISQITTNYGLDLYGKPKLAELLRALGEVEIPWIRVHYAYPTGLTPEVLAAYREVPNVVPYLDLRCNTATPVLRAMNRPWQADVNEGLLDRIREQLPDAVLRTTLIVGFPGETEEHFEHLKRFETHASITSASSPSRRRTALRRRTCRIGWSRTWPRPARMR